jgi:hypothetical protein
MYLFVHENPFSLIVRKYYGPIIVYKIPNIVYKMPNIYIYLKHFIKI